MKSKVYTMILSAALITGLLVGCGQDANQGNNDSSQGNVQEENSEGKTDSSQEDQTGNQMPEEDSAGETEEIESRAMYVPIAQDAYVFVDQDTDMVFTITFPEEIYNIEGNKITKEELEKGNIVKLYGNGIMLESYPGQYPGISRIEVIEEGSPSDADRYQDIVDQIYQEPDPAEPPTMNVEYTTEMAAATVMINRGGYEWIYVDKDGLSNAVAADSIHVLNWGEELADIKIKEPIDVILSFSQTPVQVEAVRYDSALMGTDNIPEGEKVEVEETDGVFGVSQIESGYVYEITGIWENGRATYGFLTLEQ